MGGGHKSYFLKRFTRQHTIEGDNATVCFRSYEDFGPEASQSWLRLLGYSSLEDVVGKRLVELASPIQPGGERAEVLAKKHLADALDHGSARFEWMALRRDGTEVPMEVVLTCIQLGEPAASLTNSTRFRLRSLDLAERSTLIDSALTAK